MKGINENQQRGLLTVAVIVLAIWLLSKIFSAFKAVGEKLEIVEDDETKAADAQNKTASKKSTTPDASFSGGYMLTNYIGAGLKKYKYATTYKNEETPRNLAKRIYDAIGFVYDSPAQIEGVFQNVPTKTQVSQIAAAFYQRYGYSLPAFLNDRLDTDEQKQTLSRIYSRLDSLPTGFHN